MQRTTTASNWDRVLPILLILAGAGSAVIGLSADLLAFGGPSGIGPRQVSLAMCGIAILLAGLILLLPIHWRSIAEWALVGLAAVAASFAADLVVINGLPEPLAKGAVLLAVGLSVIVMPVAAGNHLEKRDWAPDLGLVKVRLWEFLSVAVPLAGLVLVIRQFRLENQAVYVNLMALTFYGFVLHYLLPGRYRQTFFLLLSLSALAGILGVANAAVLLLIGLGLVAICHLPLAYSARVVLLLVAGGALVVLRAGWVPAASLGVIWPVLASMFMFRLIIYIYDLKHGKAQPTLVSTLSYFFLLPNVVFPFFPVVDYSTFRRTYYNDAEHRIYQTGLQWMLRGVVQLILYRYVSYYVAMAPEDVTNAAELLRYLIANFALYLRISGQFHLIIGLMHLFGFNLPETHHLYFLASSFTDLWRRINIYWKDFMLKVFYYPAYFKIRRWGTTASLLSATFFVFCLTWFFHAYQWFWLRGSFLLSVPDILFWLILALLVLVNTMYEAKRGRKRTLGQSRQTLSELAGLALRTAGTFTVMAVLWGLWSSPSIQDWVALLTVVEPTFADMAVILGGFMTITLAFGLVLWWGARAASDAGSIAATAARPRSVLVTAASILLLYLGGHPAVYGRFGQQTAALVSDLTVGRLSDHEAALLQRGYYEDLIGVNRFNGELWDIYNRRPSDWPSIMDTEAVRETGDGLIFELTPSVTMFFHGAALSTNRWGMRDQDYEMTPMPGTFRIALTGPSFVMGSGVADDEVFDSLLEERLNRDHGGVEHDHYEILNFAVPGYSAVQDLILLEQRALEFQPDALFFVAHQREEEAVLRYLADRLSVGAELSHVELARFTEQADANSEVTKVGIERRLKPFGTDILAWTYGRIVEVCREHGVLPVWVFMPTLEEPLQRGEMERLSGLAEEAGFRVLDLSNAYENQNLASLEVAYWDKHPNAQGHELIFETLYQALWENRTDIPIGLAADTNSP